MGCYVAHLTPGGGKSRRLAFATNSQATPEQGGHQAQAEPPQSHQQPPRTELEKQGARCKSLLSIYPNSLNSEIELGGRIVIKWLELSGNSNNQVSSLLIILACTALFC